MNRIPADLAAFVLAALCVVAITVLAALGVAVPDVLVTIGLVSAGAGGGAAIPRGRATAPAIERTAEQPPTVGLVTR